MYNDALYYKSMPCAVSISMSIPMKMLGALLIDLYLSTALITHPLPINPTMKIKANTVGTAIATKDMRNATNTAEAI